MLINLEDFDGNRTAILVNEFRIANEESGYRIFYKNFSSPLGRSLPAKGTKFRYSCLIWQYGLLSFQTEGAKLERFLHKNQYTQRKLLYFENWINGGLRSFQKSEF